MVLSKNVVNPCILVSLPFVVFPKLPVSQVHRCTHLCEGKDMAPVPRRASALLTENRDSCRAPPAPLWGKAGANAEEGEDGRGQPHVQTRS